MKRIKVAHDLSDQSFYFYLSLDQQALTVKMKHTKAHCCVENCVQYPITDSLTSQPLLPLIPLHEGAGKGLVLRLCKFRFKGAGLK